MSNYAAIPEPSNTLEGLRDSVTALKQVVETLTQQRGATNKPSGAVTFADLISIGLISADYVRSTYGDIGTHNASEFVSDPGAWITYTPSRSTSVGTLTSTSASGAYAKLGKTVHYRATVNITTNGTGAGVLNVGLPFTAVGTCVGVGRENLVTGKELQAVISASGNVASVIYYDNSYPGADGAQLFISGTFETA